MLDKQLLHERRLCRHLLHTVGVDVPREEIDRHRVRGAVAKEMISPVWYAGNGRPTDLQVWECRFQMLRHRRIELEETLRPPVPIARLGSPVVRRIRPVARRAPEIGLVPDFPVLHFELVLERDRLCGPAPSLVVVPDDVLRDTCPLSEILRHIGRTILLRPLVRAVSEPEHDLRARETR